MSRTVLTVVFLAGVFSGTGVLAGTVDLPDVGNNTNKITFDTSGFANSYSVISGTVTNPADAVGYDLTDFSRIGGVGNSSSSATLELGFGSTLVNGTGDDLWIYKIGYIEAFDLTINGVTNTYTPLDTYERQGGGDNLWVRLAKIDLDDFRLSSGNTGIDMIRISTHYDQTGGYYTTPDIAAVGSRLAVVPLPSTALGGLGLLVGAFVLRRFRRRRLRRL